MPRTPSKVLILTSSCGGGLLQAALAKEQEVLKRDPHAAISRRDMIKDWFWKIAGRYSVKKWNAAQRKGDIAKLEWLLNWQGVADVIFWPWTFFYALKTFFQEEIDRIIDTQPLGTSSILCALRIYNRTKKKNVVLEKIVVDLPTRANTHFFSSVKKLSHKNRQLLRMITLPPLCDDHKQTPEEFWRKYCNCSEKEIVYEYYPVRQSFQKYKGKKKEEEELTLEIRIGNQEERAFLTSALLSSPIQADIQHSSAKLYIPSRDKVVTLLLGSQPAFDATLGYIKQFIALAKSQPLERALHLFVFCSNHRMGEDSLLKRVSDLSTEALDPSKKMSVVPLSFQSDEMIAPLFHRSDLTCTRSGGQTMMELMCVMRGEIWIHSETKHNVLEEPPLEELLKGIPGWEAGNALYLCHFFNAKIVTPFSAGFHAKRFLL